MHILNDKILRNNIHHNVLITNIIVYYCSYQQEAADTLPLFTTSADRVYNMDTGYIIHIKSEYYLTNETFHRICH